MQWRIAMVSAETSLKLVRVPQMYLRIIWVIKSPRGTHSALYRDLSTG